MSWHFIPLPYRGTPEARARESAQPNVRGRTLTQIITLWLCFGITLQSGPLNMHLSSLFLFIYSKDVYQMLIDDDNDVDDTVIASVSG